MLQPQSSELTDFSKMHSMRTQATSVNMVSRDTINSKDLPPHSGINTDETAAVSAPIFGDHTKSVQLLLDEQN